ncbi:DUF6706 family protein [Fibrella sp. ES10-3-2-2]|nr:hypothetical protein A6C57_00305 [Fibrella sp. ES10-3-2-2]
MAEPTNKEIIAAKVQSFGLDLDEVELKGLLVDHDVDGELEYDKAWKEPVKKLLLDYLSTILARPDVTEGGYAVKWDRTGVATYIARLETDLGLTTKPAIVISSAEDMW